MQRLTIAEFKEAFRSVVPDGDEVVVLYSGLWSFGHRFGIRPAELVDRLIGAILEVIGPDRTLLMPTYSYQFAGEHIYDISRSQPFTGAVADRFRLWPGSERTRQPMNSYAVFGPRKDEVLKRPCTTSWGSDSVMGWFDEVNARHVMLGVPWHLSCSYCHRAEEVVGVPYRYHKRFNGVLQDNGETLGECHEVLYVRPFHVDPQLSYERIRSRLGELDLVIESGHSEFQLESSLSSDILRVATKLLTDDRMAFVGDPVRAKQWIRDKRNDEIKEIPPERRPPFDQRPIVTSG